MLLQTHPIWTPAPSVSRAQGVREQNKSSPLLIDWKISQVPPWEAQGAAADGGRLGAAAQKATQTRGRSAAIMVPAQRRRAGRGGLRRAAPPLCPQLPGRSQQACGGVCSMGFVCLVSGDFASRPNRCLPLLSLSLLMGIKFLLRSLSPQLWSVMTGPQNCLCSCSW